MRCLIIIVLLVAFGCRSTTKEDIDLTQQRESILASYGASFEHADKIVIYSLASEGPSNYPLSPADKGTFHGFSVYGVTAVTETADISNVWTDLRDRVLLGDLYTYCFWPRHGIRAYQGKIFRDYAICFECNHLYLYKSSTGEEHERIGLMSIDRPLILNQILDFRGVPREQPKK